MADTTLRLVLKHLEAELQRWQDDADAESVVEHWSAERKAEFRAEGNAFSKAVKLVQAYDRAARRAGIKRR